MRIKLVSTKIILFLFCLLFTLSINAQTTLNATGSSGSGYTDVTNAGFQIENPDCAHPAFGAHVTRASDSQLGKNVFVFHSHIEADNDRCINFDRVRMEIKGGYTSTLGHSNGQTAYYRWKFKLDANFIGSSSFCHIFQIKGYGGDDTGAPLITITPRASTLQVIHDGGDVSGSVDLGVLKEVSLSPFKGQWVEAYVKYKSSDNGLFEITLTRVSDGAVLLSYSKSSGIDMWRTGASRNQGKWGVYRKKVSGLRDEQVRFADFCVSESSASQCPSTITQQFALFIEAESGSLTSPMAKYSDANASGGQYIQVPSGSGSNSTSSPPSTGRATYNFTVPYTGVYQVEARVIAPTTGTDSFWIQMDNGSWINWNEIAICSSWSWRTVHNNANGNQIVNFNLSAGSHTLRVAYRERGTKIDRIRIYNYGLRKETASEEVEKEEVSSMPNDFILAAAYPNPFNPTTNISYKLPEAGEVKLVIYDMMGQEVSTLVNEFQQSGSYMVTWNAANAGRNLASGTYIARIQSGNLVKSIKLLLLK